MNVLYMLPFLFGCTIVGSSKYVSAPYDLHVQDSEVSKQLEISWLQNENFGKSYNYDVRYRKYEVGRPVPKRWDYTGVVSERRFLISDLTTGTVYEIQIRARELEHGRLRATSEWSNTRRITLSGPAPTEGPMHTLSTPTHFHVAVEGPDKIYAEWQDLESISGVVYVLTVQKRDPTGAFSQSQNLVLAGATRFTVKGLEPGGIYRINLRKEFKDRSRGISDDTPYQIVTLPYRRDFVTVDKVYIQEPAYATRRGSLNTTWELSNPDLSHNIAGYEVYYSTDRQRPMSQWKKQYFSGSKTNGLLYELPPDTSYSLIFVLKMIDGREFQSIPFRFQTPNLKPIRDLKIVQVNGGQDPTQIRLQWTFEPYVDRRRITGYEVYTTTNPTLPLQFWEKYIVSSKQPEIPLTNLTPGTKYYMKMNILMSDGSKVESKQFEFNTKPMEQVHIPDPPSQPIPLNIQRLQEEGAVRLTWNWPRRTGSGRYNGALLLYTDNAYLPDPEWEQNFISDTRTSYTLYGLDPNVKYFFKFIPRTRERDGRNTYARQGAAITTLPKVQVIPQPPIVRPPAPPVRVVTERPVRQTHPPRPQGPGSRLCLRTCRPGHRSRDGRLDDGCPRSEICVANLSKPNEGWCMHISIIQAAKATNT